MVVVDASEEVRLLFRGLLESRAGFVVVGEARDIEGAIALVVAEEPDLAVIDATLLGPDPAGAIATMAASALTKVVIVFADDHPDPTALLDAGAFMVLDRAAALRIANILDRGAREAATPGVVSIEDAIEIACRCDHDGCGGTIRFVATPTRMLTDGTAIGDCLRCGRPYRLVNATIDLTDVGQDAGPPAHRLLNAAAATVDAVRAARSESDERGDDRVGVLLDVAERQGAIVVEGLRELILGLPLGFLTSTERDDG